MGAVGELLVPGQFETRWQEQRGSRVQERVVYGVVDLNGFICYTGVDLTYRKI